MEASYNSRCPAVKRLFREAKELHEATEEYYAQPLEDNLFEWHFTVRGPPDTEFDGGIYHGRIIMPADYPMKPPNIIFLTPNGRFETNKKICLSISGHHPETWQPSWSIRTALLAIIGFMPTPANGTIGSLDYTPQERAKLAKKSQEYECVECGCVSMLLKERTGDNKAIQDEAREVMGQVTVTAKVEQKEKTSEPLEASALEGRAVNRTESPKSKSSSACEENNEASQNDDSRQREISGTAVDRETPSSTASESTDEVTQEILMEGAPRNNPRNPVSNPGHVASSGYLYNTVLSSAIILFIALVLRRVFLLETDVNEELDDVLL
ncbi:Ubiquitin-conjugating enzyme E2 J1 [Halocaridina rubra]|uniref:Ubiquitin-conjugating enzyme E2 J1 n=1 Tax=Halocaridina rubra TaxID=373956 RepID=A0AAN8WV32_HALRR